MMYIEDGELHGLEIKRFQVLGKVGGKTFEVAVISACSWEQAEKIVELKYPDCWVEGEIIDEI